jgi:hypothetical protein
MNPNKYIGAIGMRVACACFALLGALTLAQYEFGFLGEPRPWTLKLALFFGFLTLLAGVHWSPPIYAGWMRFAKILNTVMVTLLFSAVYLVIVPIFFLIARALDPLRLRPRPGSETYWIKKRDTAATARSLQSMA